MRRRTLGTVAVAATWEEARNLAGDVRLVDLEGGWGEGGGGGGKWSLSPTCPHQSTTSCPSPVLPLK